MLFCSFLLSLHHLGFDGGRKELKLEERPKWSRKKEKKGEVEPTHSKVREPKKECQEQKCIIPVPVSCFLGTLKLWKRLTPLAFSGGCCRDGEVGPDLKLCMTLLLASHVSTYEMEMQIIQVECPPPLNAGDQRVRCSLTWEYLYLWNLREKTQI